MSNHNESNNPEEIMQEQLCAYIFGELDAPDRAADRNHVEQRLAESSAWRTEHERLQGTVSLVKSALHPSEAAAASNSSTATSAGIPETLSNASLEALKAAAVSGAVSGTLAGPGSGGRESGNGGLTAPQVMHPPLPKNSSPMRIFVPIAAGLAVTLGGVMAWKNMNQTMEPSLLESNTAYADEANSPEESLPSDAGIAKSGFEKGGAVRSIGREPTMHASTIVLEESEVAEDALLESLKEAQLELKSAGSAAGVDVFLLGKGAEDIAPGEVPPDPSIGLLARFETPATRGVDTVTVSKGNPNQNTVGGVNTMDALESAGWSPERSKYKQQLSSRSRENSSVGGGSYRGPGDAVPPGGVPSTVSRDHLVTQFAPELKSPERGRAAERVANKPAGPGNAGGGPTTGGATPALDPVPQSDAEAPAAPSMPGPGSPGPSKSAAPTEGDGLKGSGKGEIPAEGTFFDDANDGANDGAFAGRTENFFNEDLKKDDQGRFDQGESTRETPAQMELRLRSEMEARAKVRSEQILIDCTPKPKELPRDMYYRWWGDNPFVYTSSDKLATFAADVDTASYTLARRYLVENTIPTKAQIRTEEFVNYFAGDITPPTEGTFNVSSELIKSPFGGSANRYMLRVGVRGKVIPKEERPPMALVYVVDTSGSMNSGNRMDLVKHSLRLLGTELDGRDQVGIVAFSDTARLVLPMTSMEERATLESAIQGLTTGGSTNVEDGMRLGYELLSRVSSKGQLRRVVLISDGVANTGNTTADAILGRVVDHRKNGILLSTVGVGMGNHNDALLERLADRGDGICDYVDDEAAAKRAMVDRFSGGFIPIARDLKIQVEFDGARVLRYRQIGYENRAVADKDFRNDAVDGGEVGSGHQITALFELDCVTVPVESSDGVEVLATVRLRHKTVATGEAENVTETEHPVHSMDWDKTVDGAAPGMQRAVIAAQFAEFLRRSTHTQADDYGQLALHAARIADLPAFAGDADTKELRDMIKRAGELGAGLRPELTELDMTIDAYRKHRILCGLEEQLQGQLKQQRLQDILRQNAELERRIQELCLEEARSGR